MTVHRNKVFVVDKPVGPTSFDVVARVRKATGVRKVGHAGTLDPAASGVLLVCTGNATRATNCFMALEKTYHFTVRLGVATETDDVEGDVTNESPVPAFSHQELVDVVESFVGTYHMRPPAYSALKVAGKRAYALARAGDAPEIPARDVEVYDCRLERAELPHLECVVRCAKGTYVRALARDIGERLGVPSHMAALTRVAIGRFGRGDAVPFDNITADAIASVPSLNVEDALSFLPAIKLHPDATVALADGHRPTNADIADRIGQLNGADVVRVLSDSGDLLAIAPLAPERFSLPATDATVPVIDSFRSMVDAG